MLETLKNLFKLIIFTSNNLNVTKIKEYLPIIFIIPTCIGGLWQLFELSYFGISYIRFFSVPQILPDGLLIIIMITTISIYLFYLTQAHEISSILELSGKSFPILIRDLIINIFLSIGAIILLTYKFKELKQFIPYVIFIATLYFLFHCILYILKILIIISYKLKGKDISKLNEFVDNIKNQRLNNTYTIWISLVILLVFTITVAILIVSLRNFAYYPSDLENLNKLENELIKNFRLCEPPKLEYFNRDYLFYEINIEDKKKIYIIESKNLFLSPLDPNIKEKKENED